MPRRLASRSTVVAVVVVLAACNGGEPSGPSTQPPAHVAATTELVRTAPVATVVPSGVAVKVTDAAGRPVVSASVAFAVTLGNGAADPRVAITGADGVAAATWTLGTVAGPNEVTASVLGVSDVVKFEATGTPGAAQSLAIGTASIRIAATLDTATISAKALDGYGNLVSPPPTFVPRDPTLVAVDSTGLVHVLRRGASTYVVVSAGTHVDSVFVTVLAPGQSICTGTATPLELAVGQVVTDVPSAGVCIHASSANAEYAIIPFYNTLDTTASISLGVEGQGVVPLPLPSGNVALSRRPVLSMPRLVPDEAFEARLRERERTEAVQRLTGARAWLHANASILGASDATITVPKVGDLLRFNVNANDYCANPDYRTGRVAAVTNNAIVVADTANPPGGFTDAEYQAIGVTFDTLVIPVDTTNFGAPSDIDHNGHEILFFTRAVNELTPQASSSVVLGFFYSRDLYPQTVGSSSLYPSLACPGSNDGEMFYLLVPDTAGVVNGNVRLKPQVVGFTDGTVAHEFQHLINASRRMYVNNVGPLFEERWLDEGLAHTAEELNFFRSANVSPRQNIGPSAYADPNFQSAFYTFERNNFLRYGTYLQGTEQQAPLGYDSNDDDLPTRGAIWNFLRYAADHRPAGTETSFWRALVNSTTTGIANLTNALGAPPNESFRDWAISVYADDNADGVDPLYQQPSWNLRADFSPYGISTPFPLFVRTLSDGATNNVTLTALGVSFLQFSVASGTDALLTTSVGGQPAPTTVEVNVIRIR